MRVKSFLAISVTISLLTGCQVHRCCQHTGRYVNPGLSTRCACSPVQVSVASSTAASKTGSLELLPPSKTLDLSPPVSQPENFNVVPATPRPLVQRELDSTSLATENSARRNPVPRRFVPPVVADIREADRSPAADSSGDMPSALSKQAPTLADRNEVVSEDRVDDSQNSVVDSEADPVNRSSSEKPSTELPTQPEQHAVNDEPEVDQQEPARDTITTRVPLEGNQSLNAKPDPIVLHAQTRPRVLSVEVDESSRPTGQPLVDPVSGEKLGDQVEFAQLPSLVQSAPEDANQATYRDDRRPIVLKLPSANGPTITTPPPAIDETTELQAPSIDLPTRGQPYYLPPQKMLRLKATTPLGHPVPQPSVANWLRRDTVVVGGYRLLDDRQPIEPGKRQATQLAEQPSTVDQAMQRFK